VIDDVLVFLRDRLNAHLRRGESPAESAEDKVVFVDGEQMDPIVFKLGAITVLLVNVEEDASLRPADRFVRSKDDGTSVRVQPEIRMNLYVLFVARFKEYDRGLAYMSRIIQHFQQYTVLDHHNAPELSDSIPKLVMELVTLPFSEQSEIWSALRTTYHPSVLYRVRLVVFSDDREHRIPPVVTVQGVRRFGRSDATG
jgi:hypothetical protein